MTNRVRYVSIRRTPILNDAERAYGRPSHGAGIHKPQASIAPIRHRAIVTQVLLVVNIVLSIAVIAASVVDITILAIAASGGTIPDEVWGLNESVFTFLGSLQTGLYWVTAIAFLIWLHRAYRNVTTLGAEGLESTPGWAVGVWFIPFANLIYPFKVLREVYKASFTASGPHDKTSWRSVQTPAVIPLWWGSFIISNFLDKVVSGIMSAAQDIESWIIGSYLIILTEILYISAAALLITITRRISKTQDSISRVNL